MNISLSFKITLYTLLLFFSTNPIFAEKTNILVYPFKNTGDKKYEWMSAGLTDTVISDLYKIKSINVFSEEDRRKAILEIELGMTGLIEDKQIVGLGKIMGAHLIFTGTYTIINDNIRIIAKIIQVDTTKIEKSIKIDGNQNNIFDLQDKIVLNLMSESEHIKPIKISNDEKQKIIDKPKIDQHAFELYSNGLSLHYSDPQKALDYYLKALKADPEYFNAIKKAGQIYIYFNKFNDADEYFQKALNLLSAQKLSNSREYAEILIEIADLYYRKAEYNESINYSKKAIEIYEKLEETNSLDYAEAMKVLGYSYGDLRMGGGLSYFLKSKKIYEILGMKKTKYYSTILQNIGIEYDNSNNYDMALKYYFKSKKIDEKLGLKKTKTFASTLCVIGITYFNKKDYNNALKYYTESIEIHKKAGTLQTKNCSDTYYWIGKVYDTLNNPCKGAENMQKSVKILEDIKFPEKGFLNRKNELIRIQKKCGKY